MPFKQKEESEVRDVHNHCSVCRCQCGRKTRRGKSESTRRSATRHCRTPGNRGYAGLNWEQHWTSCGQTLMSSWEPEDLANPPWPGWALTSFRGASSLKITVSCGFTAIIALNGGCRRTQSHTKRTSSLRVASGYSTLHPPNWLH